MKKISKFRGGKEDSAYMIVHLGKPYQMFGPEASQRVFSGLMHQIHTHFNICSCLGARLALSTQASQHRLMQMQPEVFIYAISLFFPRYLHKCQVERQ